MTNEFFVERLFEALIAGDRPASRRVVEDACGRGATPEQLVSDIFWPTYEIIQRSHREDRMTTLAHHLATRLLRVLVDQAAANFTAQPTNARTIFAVCGPTDADELAAQMAVDLLEAQGFSVAFAGGGIARDEILEQVQERRPDILLLFASAPNDLPNIRTLVDTMHEIGACRETQIAVGGGVFNRAEGLAEEIGADVWATSPTELVAVLANKVHQRARADQRTVGRKRRREAA
ncbi:MAG: cobalamin B12-binding domain-containing protein [Phycisphaerales bacterium]|nr:cobalamin B12-binding domain-containing protein [Phycisphaerales bacterium]